MSSRQKKGTYPYSYLRGKKAEGETHYAEKGKLLFPGKRASSYERGSVRQPSWGEVNTTDKFPWEKKKTWTDLWLREKRKTIFHLSYEKIKSKFSYTKEKSNGNWPSRRRRGRQGYEESLCFLTKRNGESDIANGKKGVGGA